MLLKIASLFKYIALQVIAKRKQLLADGNNNQSQSQSEEDLDGPKKRQVFIDVLLTTMIDGRPMSDSEISDEVSTFFFAVRFIFLITIYNCKHIFVFLNRDMTLLHRP